VWYSTTEEFTDEKCKWQVCQVKPGSDVEAVVRVPEAPEFLRVGLGEFFSVHEDPVLVIRRLPEGKGEPSDGDEVTVDLARAPTHTRQFKFHAARAGSRLVCGNRPWLILANPFPGRDIEVRFISRLERML
jgi:hypothetical protein